MNIDFKDLKVLLIGDFMIDQYILCTSSRMSPEAPVPVLNPKKIYSAPGGAGNVALNLNSLGANVSCFGCIGNDMQGSELTQILKKNGIDIKFMNTIDSNTTLKKRYYLDGKQIIRVDFEKVIKNWKPTNENLEYHKYDLILLSDYNKGVLNSKWFTKIKYKNIVVDPKKNDFLFFYNASIITPNLNELKRASNLKIIDNSSLVKACQLIIKNSNLKYILAKKGDKGMTIVGKEGYFKHIKAHKIENPDVTGAGDTVISALSLAYAKTNDIEYSAKFANAAGAVAVGKPGTATVTIEEINNYI